MVFLEFCRAFSPLLRTTKTQTLFRKIWAESSLWSLVAGQEAGHKGCIQLQTAAWRAGALSQTFFTRLGGGGGVDREVSLASSKYLFPYLHSNPVGHTETLKLHIETWEVLQSHP